MKIWCRIVLVLIAMAMLAACGSNQVTGDGKTVTKTRAVQQFNQIKISGAYRVKITQGTQPSLSITTDSNIIPLVITKVTGQQLLINNKAGVSFRLTEPVLIQIVVKDLNQVVASGANALTISKLNTENLKLDTSGSVQANLSGKVENLDMQVAGSGNINAIHLVAETVKIRLMGSGNVTVNATDKLDTKITGNGTIQYSGDPANVNQSIVGSGTLERMK